MSVTLNTPFSVAPAAPFGALSGVAPAILQQWLTDALNARHKLLTGAQPNVVLYASGEGSRSVTYTRTSLSNLSMYITELQAALGMAPRRRAIGVRFG